MCYNLYGDNMYIILNNKKIRADSTVLFQPVTFNFWDISKSKNKTRFYKKNKIQV